MDLTVHQVRKLRWFESIPAHWSSSLCLSLSNGDRPGTRIRRLPDKPPNRLRRGTCATLSDTPGASMSWRGVGDYPVFLILDAAGRIEESSNGRTPDFGSGHRGSNPCSPATLAARRQHEAGTSLTMVASQSCCSLSHRPSSRRCERTTGSGRLSARSHATCSPPCGHLARCARTGRVPCMAGTGTIGDGACTATAPAPA
jgi:hypothetical protein